MRGWKEDENFCVKSGSRRVAIFHHHICVCIYTFFSWVSCKKKGIFPCSNSEGYDEWFLCRRGGGKRMSEGANGEIIKK